ncbi:DNA mismatch endonuclease Vsr [Stutzerimonas nosocomialis]|uniref:very short patch repair endonuclease n=1 Tax=Pseudomonadales TaxID=72274 RepID=UPI00028E16C1|nr:very short patch repair endonuclease [Stutzerimonas nosocomialis]EKM96329.1 DNA mismatch endonuclease Vsr [Stutzerimonas degradans]TLX54596.1 DNA mismatch endonuclease Vsr [Stutzerimonas nosocomialis]
MDIVDPARRSRMMATIRGKDTKPEMLVRRFLHAHGFRFRLHRADLPGKPDIVLPRLRTCIFVHGCFWHRHAGCRYAVLPKTRPEFWAAKLEGNAARDRHAVAALRAAGWRVIVVWECDLRKPETALPELLQALKAASPNE